MLTRLHITLLLAAAAAVWTIALIVRGVPVTAELLIPFGIAVSALTLLCVGFNKWCWRYFVFKGWLVQRPWLQGTWRVVLQSSWIDPETNQPIPPINGYIVIHQTFSALILRLYTPESGSASVAASILASEDCLFRVVTTYQNEPSAALRGVRSEIHYGAMLLNVHDDPPQSLSGHYWTDRKTTGTIELSDRKTKLVSSFKDAQALFGA
jgi:hypothetical protein